MVLNFGPQHPAAHGQLRLILELDGEKVIKADPHVGYMHRGMEKMAENMIYSEFIPVTDRIDYLASTGCNYGFVLAVEKLCGIEVPRTAEIIWLLCGLTLLGIACTLTIKTIGNSFAIRISWALLSTIVALRAIALYQITTCGIAKCSVRTMLCYFRRIGAIFSRRKFIVS